MDYWPDKVATEAELDELLSRPSPGVLELMTRLDGDIVILGVAGKMGVTLAMMAARAVRESGIDRRVIGVSRFSQPEARETLESAGVATIPCDLLDAAAVRRLPAAANVVYMAGRKFGTEENRELTWRMNTEVPRNAAVHYADSRIVAFSTGCVYPLVGIDSLGCREDEPPAPIGDYAESCHGREQEFAKRSAGHGTPVCLFRLNYAVDLRYGVLHDIAAAIAADRPVDLSAPYFNAIWQGDANAQALLALECCESPPRVLNVTGPEIASVRDVALELGRLMGMKVSFTGEPSPVMYLNNAGLAAQLFGYPRVAMGQLVDWTAQWHLAGGRSLGKPTHFEVTSGKF